MALEPIRVLFVCLGNICRSPTAEGVFTALVAQREFTGKIEVDSCGTSDWHVGEPPDHRAIRAAAARGYPIHHLRARQVCAADFDRFDYILAMDESNLENLRILCPSGFRGHLGLFLEFAPDAGLSEMPDPYYGDGAGFEQVLNLCETASESLLQVLHSRRVRGNDRPPQ